MVTDLYGAGLTRVLELAGAEAPELVVRLAGDELVGSLLLVHGLHPESLGTRVEGALEGVRPFLAQHGGDVELLDMDPAAGAVLLRLLGSCDGCPSSAVTLQQAVERAVFEAAPEIVKIDVAEAADQDTGGPATTPPGASVPVTLGPRPTYDSCPSEIGT